VQLIVPTGDNYVGTQLFSELTDWVEHLYRRDIDATHWVLLTHAPQVAQWIADFAHTIDSNQEDSALRAVRVSAVSSSPFSAAQQPEQA
jgi:hypothetical protein